MRRPAALVLALGLLAPGARAWAQVPAPSLPDVPVVSPAALPADQAGVFRAGWVPQDDGGPVYYNPVTHLPHEGWLSLGAARYYIDPDTHRPHVGWLDLDGARFLMGDGATAPVGVMLADRWVTRDGARYHLSATGPADTGWVEVDGDLRLFAADGRLVTGWVRGEGGSLLWARPEDGTLARDEWVEVDGVYQAFAPDGTWATAEDVVPADDAANMASLTPAQRALIDACGTVPWPGANLCAGWVSSVFTRAGLPAVGGNACDVARAWCTSTDPDDLEPGMVVAVVSHPHTRAGTTYGHVGIYVGDGIVCDSSRTGLRRAGLGSWVAWYGATNPVGWGWANGRDLSTA